MAVRYFLISLIIFNLVYPVFAQDQNRPVFSGGVEQSWTADRAKEEAFNGAQFFRNISGLPSKDPFYLENSQAILKASASTIRIKNRSITIFYTYEGREYRGYAVKEDNSKIGFYFSSEGRLQAVEYESGPDYPIKIYRYQYPKGKLTAVGMHVKPGDDYLYHPTGKLEIHCINSKCYNDTGKPVIYRKIF